MKAIMISIKPKYVAKILNGEKTIEIRKTCPQVFKNLKPYEGCSIDVYIYCTKDTKNGLYWTNKWVCVNQTNCVPSIRNSKVVAKFTLKKVQECVNPYFTKNSFIAPNLIYEDLLKWGCLSESEFDNYLSKGKRGYAWHIDNLVIFDKPKELSEFYRIVLVNKLEGYEKPLTQAPQSWCYVEELK